MPPNPVPKIQVATLLVCSVVLVSCGKSCNAAGKMAASSSSLSDDEKCMLALQQLLYNTYVKDQAETPVNVGAMLDPSRYIYSVSRNETTNIYRLTPILDERIKVFRHSTHRWPSEVTIDRKTQKIIALAAN